MCGRYAKMLFEQTNLEFVCEKEKSIIEFSKCTSESKLKY